MDSESAGAVVVEMAEQPNESGFTRDELRPPQHLLTAKSPQAESALADQPLTLEQVISFVQGMEPREDTSSPSFILTHRLFWVLGCRYVLLPDDNTVVNLGSEDEGEFRGSCPR